MSSTQLLSSIEMLQGAINYRTWAIRMRAALQYYGFWPEVSGTAPCPPRQTSTTPTVAAMATTPAIPAVYTVMNQDEITAWLNRDQQAQGIIVT